MTEPKWWDVTIPEDKLGVPVEEFTDFLDRNCERYCIGFETGASGYRHLQVRLVWKIGKTLEACRHICATGHWSQSHVRDFKYCEKEGNFIRSWEKALRKFANLDLMDWQQDVIDKMDVQDDRQVLVIVDPIGNHGKTWLAKYCVATHKAAYVPPMQDSQDFMAYALAHENSKGFIFDMPRTESIKQKKGMWSAIEQIKNGYFFDKRYQWREMWVDPPTVVVITNEFPDEDTLSADRWDIWTLSDEPLGTMLIKPEWD